MKRRGFVLRRYGFKEGEVNLLDGVIALLVEAVDVALGTDAAGGQRVADAPLVPLETDGRDDGVKQPALLFKAFGAVLHRAGKGRHGASSSMVLATATAAAVGCAGRVPVAGASAARRRPR